MYQLIGKSLRTADVTLLYLPLRQRAGSAVAIIPGSPDTSDGLREDDEKQ
jgi:hypothetical protein